MRDGTTGRPAATEEPAATASTSTEPGEAKDAAVLRPSRDDSGPEPAGASSAVLNPSLIALAVWLVCLPVAYGAVRLLRPGNPFDLRTAMIPVAVGAVVLAVTAVVTRRGQAEMVSGLAAGLFAGWVAGRVGAPETVAFGGIICVIAASVFSMRLPALRPAARRLIVAQEIAGGDPAAEMTAPSLAVED